MTTYISQNTIQHLQHIQRLLDQLQPDGPSRALIVPGSPKPQKTIIVFPGSFNPPTHAHLALLKQAHRFARQGGAVVSLYAAISKRIVDKERVERPTLLDRIQLLHGVLQRHARHTGILLFNKGLYVEQAQAIYASFLQVKHLFFLLGFDKIVQIFDPHYYEDRDASLEVLFHEAELLVAPRGDDGEQELITLLQKPENVRFAHFVHPLPLDAQYRYISSTHVRQENDQHDVPVEVREFMRETRAYAPPLQRADGTELDYYAERVRMLDLCVRYGKHGT